MDRYSPELEHTLLRMSDLIFTVGETNLLITKDLHSDEGRLFHNWSHALDVLSAVLKLGLPDVPRRAHALAAIFHDVIHVVGDKNNQANSVKVMMKMTDGKESESVMAAADLIMMSAKHQTSTIDTVATNHRDFLDCDLLHLGSECWPLVVQYDYAEWAEKLIAGWDLEDMLMERQRVLMCFMAKPTIFLGSHFGTKHEWNARLNIRKLANHRHDFAPLVEKLKPKVPRSDARSLRRDH